MLVSVGRKPNSAVPGLDKTGVKVGERGFITVDAALRTAEPNIFAIGDVVGEPMLAHKASHEARVAVEAIAGHKVAFEPQAIPAVVFTDPEVAWCGLTETDAQKQGRKVEIAKFPWAALGRAIAIDRPDGMTKLVIDPETERILGVGIVGAGAGELIAEGVLAVEMAALATDLKLTHSPASDAVGDADGGRRGVLRPFDARVPAEEEGRRAVDLADAQCRDRFCRILERPRPAGQWAEGRFAPEFVPTLGQVKAISAMFRAV